MSEEIRATINRFIEGRGKQIVEMEVIKMVQELKKSKAQDKESQAKATMAIQKLNDSQKELENEVTLLKEL